MIFFARKIILLVLVLLVFPVLGFFDCDPSLNCGSEHCKWEEISVSRDNKLRCYCDHACELFGDCCAHYSPVCVGEMEFSVCMNFTTFKNVSSITNFLKIQQSNEYSSDGPIGSCYDKPEISKAISINITNGTFEHLMCYHLKEEEFVHGIWMITKCPDETRDQQLREKCENIPSRLEQDSLDSLLPVAGQDLLNYRNKFCAVCHNIQFASPWRMYFYCPDEIPGIYNKNLTWLASNCEHKITPGDNPRRYCLKVVKMCSPAWPQITTRQKLVKKECENGSFGVVYDVVLSSNFKNIACSVCNFGGISLSCGPKVRKVIQPTANTVSFSIILDFNWNTDISVTHIQCGVGRFYDRSLQDCRNYLTDISSSAQFDQYIVILWLEPLNHKTSKLLIKPNDVVTSLENVCQGTEVGCNSIKHNVSEMIRVEALLDFPLRVSEFEKSEGKVCDLGCRCVKNILQISTQLKILIGKDVFRIVKTSFNLVRCAQPEFYEVDEYTYITNSSKEIFIASLNRSFPPHEYYTRATNPLTLVICHPKARSCEGQKYILLHKNEYDILPNRSLFRKRTKKLYAYEEYSMLNESIWVCDWVSYSNNQFNILENQHALVLLTKVGFSLSIVSLLLVLVVYFGFSNLRTLPGKNLMNLCISILLYQLLWLLGVSETGTVSVCKTIAVGLHFFILVSFCWMTCIACDSCRVFSNMDTTRMIDPASNSFFIYYFVFSWFTPLLLVTIFAVLDITGAYDIGYGNQYACWITQTHAAFWGIVLPVGVMIILQVYFFCRTVYSIWRTEQTVRTSQLQRGPKKTLCVAVKMSSLMGFTWLFGFLGNLHSFFWYVFVVLSTLQGVYIALAFVFNGRVLGLYKQRYPMTNRMSTTGQTRTQSLTTSRRGSSRRTFSTETIETRL